MVIYMLLSYVASGLTVGLRNNPCVFDGETGFALDCMIDSRSYGSLTGSILYRVSVTEGCECSREDKIYCKK